MNLDPHTQGFLDALDRIDKRKLMPTYDYKCPKCEMTMVVIRTLKEEERKPICVNDAIELVRDYTPPPVQFKGTGFYQNDK
jgi:putative FmdB family regulatory protein